MSENEVVGLVVITLFLCCCCLVVIGGGVGAYFVFRNQQKKSTEASATSMPVMAGTVQSPPPPDVSSEPAPVGESATLFQLPTFETAPPPAESVAEPASLENLPGPATPIEADDIRAKLLALNAPEKPYVVQATGYKIVVAPTAITGHLLEIAFDYVERVARFVETNAHAADPQLKADVRGVLEGNGWTIRE